MMGGCLHDRLLTVGVFYSQQKQAIDDTWASSRSDTAGAETTERSSVVYPNILDFRRYFICHYVDPQRISVIENGFHDCLASSSWFQLDVLLLVATPTGTAP